jgi:hypothetical protein
LVSESVEKLLDTVMSLLMLLIGMVLLFSIFFAAFNPYDNIAFANTEKLRAAINEACIKGEGGSVELKSFELRQNVPLLTGAIGAVTTAIPEFMLKQNGDPNYVLYYEAFPPGEAAGWEVFQDHQYRLLTPFTSQDSRPGSQLADAYASDQLARFTEKKPSARADALLVSNIILNDVYNPSFIPYKTANTNRQSQGGFESGGALQVEGELRQSFFRFGEWKNKNSAGQPVDGDNVFRFNNYAGMTVVQKSLVKYMPCGDNSLCLKTRSGVYRYRLSECGDIKNVQIIYDARNRPAVYGAVGLAAAAITFVAVSGGTVAAGSTIPAASVTAGSAGTYSVAAAGGGSALVSGWYTGTGTFVVTEVISTGGTTAASTTASWLTTGALGAAKVLRGFAARHPILTLFLGSTAVTSAFRWIGQSFLGFKTSDLALASPCSIRSTDGEPPIKIKYASCASVDLPGTDPSHCTQVVSYPLYSYDKATDQLVRAGEHYVCLEKINGDVGEDITEEVADANYGSNDRCVQIYISEKAVGCWTPDPFKDDVTISDTQLIASLAGFDPVKRSLDYLNPQQGAQGLLDRIVVLKPSSKEQLEGFVGTWGQASWGWPWPFDQGVIDKVTSGLH